MGTEFTRSDDLRDATFTEVDLSGATFREANLTGVHFVGTLMSGVQIDGSIDGMQINGVEVAPLVEAELNRRDPERVKIFTATDPDRVRDAWELIERRWAEAVARARRLSEEQVHERVDGEWSFTETLRHLIFVTDAHIRRTILTEANPYCPFGLVHTPMGDPSWLGIDPEADPTFDEVLAARRERLGIVRSILEELTPEQFAGTSPPNPAPGYPDPAEGPVFVWIAGLLVEEWAHLGFALRDIEVLESRGAV